MSPSSGAAPAITPTQSVGGHCRAIWGPFSQTHAAAPALADAPTERVYEPVVPLEVSSAEPVTPWSARGAPSAIFAEDPNVNVLSPFRAYHSWNHPVTVPTRYTAPGTGGPFQPPIHAGRG